MILTLSAGRDSPGELRARLTLDEGGQRQLLNAPRAGIGELAVLCTCHRTEIYATSDMDPSEALHEIAALLPTIRPTDHHHLTFLDGSEAVEHLFRVACGLDSLVVGEPQVLGQVRRAYLAAKQEGSAGPVLASIFDRAISLGRRVRAETGLGRLGMSIGSAVADYLARRLNGLEGKRGTIVGAGKIATDAARWLGKAGANLTIASRTASSADRLAEEVDAVPHQLGDLTQIVGESEFAVVAVSGGIVLRDEQIAPRDGRLIVLDLSVPPAVAIAERSEVEVLTLEELPGPRGPEVTAALIDAEAMVRKEVAALERWVDARASSPSIKELRNWAERVVRLEVDRLPGAALLSPEERERIVAAGTRIANKLLHPPTVALRDGDENARELIRRIFGLES